MGKLLNNEHTGYLGCGLYQGWGGVLGKRGKKEGLKYQKKEGRGGKTKKR